MFWCRTVFNADLIIAGLLHPCTDLMNASGPDTCGQTMDVPEFRNQRQYGSLEP
ncbi:hypothetical protein A2U01_0014242 [Trifolium medium]|uniref:Uncharacterized protein n=1 Tax=Trifolium medium TaxID=97028 RepID=A0A392N477_9FABA|nr:hypothetical protein [Trifolium medium]